ncbi:MAG: DUF2975 domain-containing protein [Oscillospiraceae bacterium]|nr:DUF2975 domain-containing protein [Oscillospiraceae bacterium]
MDWNDQKSIALSRLGVALLALLLLALDIGGYWLAGWALRISEVLGEGLKDGLLLLASLYLCSVPAWLLIFSLWRLLKNLGLELIFTAENVSLLRRISWYCVAMGLVCLLSALYYLPFMLPAIAAAFMALIVRIVKNCFEQAVLMKDELDYTV